MDLEAFKVLLEAQDKRFRTAIDIVVEQLKSRLQTAEGTITDLIKSLEFSQAEVRDLQSEVKVLRKSDIDNKATNDIFKLRIEDLEKKTNYQEDYNRRNNLRINGIQEQTGGETWEETAKTVSKLLEEKLQLPPMKLERAHRTGPTTPSRPRTVVARFERFGDREAVIRSARKLKGTGIYINEDLCPASQELKKQRLPLIKQAREEGKIAFFRHTKLIIKERSGQRSGDANSYSKTSGAGGDVAGNYGRSRSAVSLGGGLSAGADLALAGAGVGGMQDVLTTAPADAGATAKSSLDATGASVRAESPVAAVTVAAAVTVPAAVTVAAAVTGTPLGAGSVTSSGGGGSGGESATGGLTLGY